MSDAAVQNPQNPGDDSGQASNNANPQNAGDDPNVDPQNQPGDDSQTGQGGASELPKFHYQLSKEFQGHDKLSGIEKPDDLAKAYVELAEKTDSMVEIPDKEAGEEAWQEFYRKVGREVPESADGYDFTDLGLPEDIAEEDIANLKQTFHKRGLDKTQAKAFMQDIVNDLQSLQQKQTEQQEQQKQENIAQLKKEYGDNFEQKITEAHRAYEQVGSKELGDLLDSYGLGDHPVMVKAFLNIHDKIGDDTLVDGSSGGGRDTASEWFPESSKVWD